LHGHCVHLGDLIALRNEGGSPTEIYSCSHPMFPETTAKHCAKCEYRRPFDPGDNIPPPPSQRIIEEVRVSGQQRVNTWCVGITTIPTREDYFHKTVDSLASAGWRNPLVFRDDPPARGIWKNWHRALSEMTIREPNADAYLIVQDDVVFSHCVRQYLEASLWPPGRVGLCSIYTPATYDTGNGWFITNRGENLWGACAWVFPPDVAKELLHAKVIAEWDRKRNVEMAIGTWAQNEHRLVYYHTPSLAQHVGEESTISPTWKANGSRKSDSFRGEEFDATELLPRKRRQKIAERGHRDVPIAIVIPCHNYGRFLGDAIRSVINQSVRPDEIVVVDDSSTDNTQEVARSFAGVRYMRINAGSVATARAAGLHATSAPLVCFLDADDELPAAYLDNGYAMFKDPGIGLVYSDMHCFGEETRILQMPTFDPDHIEWDNYIHAGAIVRREALDLIGPLVREDPLITEDWDWWRRIVQRGWKAAKQQTVYRYRKHGLAGEQPQRSKVLKQTDYYHRAGLAYERVTIVTPLAGRMWAWGPYSAWLDRQTWPREQVAILLVNTSHDAEFSAMVREWLIRCGYPDVRVRAMRVGERDLADAPRKKAGTAVRTAMADMWQQIRLSIDSPYVLSLEDDCIPPDDGIDLLMRGFDHDVGSVAGPYLSRFHKGYVAWRLNDAGQRIHFVDRGEGYDYLDGNGFGCTLIRTQLVRNHVYRFTGDNTPQTSPDFDIAFYLALHRKKTPTNRTMKFRMCWEAEAEHLSKDMAIAPE